MLRRDQHLGDDDYYDVSFSGLKTAVMLAVKSAPNLEDAGKHIARGFQDSLTETLAEKVARAVRASGRTRVVLGGGVACNQSLVEMVRERVGPAVAVFAPSPRIATDNAAMIARAGLFHAELGHWSPLDLAATSSASIPGMISR
jgi:N6-L-threonylcarbamoyladenine synthase